MALLDCSKDCPGSDNCTEIPERVVNRRKRSTVLRVSELDNEQGCRCLREVGLAEVSSPSFILTDCVKYPNPTMNLPPMNMPEFVAVTTVAVSTVAFNLGLPVTNLARWYR